MKDNNHIFTSNKKKILIADDDRAILDALKLMLEEVGYEVNTSSDGKTIQTVKKYYPDLLLLDIWMSGVDGRDICKELKAYELTKHIPIIMISANRDTETIAKESGADDFLTKPFGMNDLLSKVEKHSKAVD
jgi:DNA-binding response OmpR family regulator